MQGNITYVAPRNDTENILATVFEMILDIQQVGIDDSFFALGGDSIKAIRMVSKLREKDVFVTVPMVMQGKTIRAISETATGQDITPTIDQQVVVGEVPLTFIQSYFFAQNLPRPHHFNQSMVLESAQRIDEGLLRQVLYALVVHHDMLRAFYSSTDRQEIRPVESQSLYNLSSYEYQDDSQWHSAMEAVCNTLQTGFDLSTGPIMQVGLFRTPSADMLFIVIHHLVVDGVSWRILIEDLNTGYRQAMEKEKIIFPPKTASFKGWSEAIERYRISYALKQEIPYWKRVQDALPAGRIPAMLTKKEGFGNVGVVLEEAQTRALLSSASVAYHTEVNDLLLCAFGRAVHHVTGQTTLSVDLEGHGREPIGENLPIDRTVGWFTSIYPVAFTEIGTDIRHDIRRVKETLRRVPNHGIGYGILQYIGEPALDRAIHPDISFNYLGELSEEHTAELFVVNNQAPQGQTVYQGNMFGSPISVNGLVEDKRLLMDIRYDRTKYSDDMITQLGDAFTQELKTLISHCVANETPELTAADLGEVAWSDTEFEDVLQETQAKGWEIERIYPLTPMQEGMLFHRIADPESTSYFIQSTFRLTSVLSQDLLKKALYQLGQKHEVLRTAILYKNLSESRQAILKGRDFEVSQVDISGYADIEEQLEIIKRLDIQRGFDLQEDSLLRVILVKISDGDYRLLWSIHHIIIDGWCLSIVMNDFMNICNTFYIGKEYVVDGQKTRIRYEDYVRNRLSSDKEAARMYWKNLLSGYSAEATICSLGNPEGGVEQEKTITYQFSKETTERIQNICSRYDVTINTAVEVAWGLVLQKYNDTDDVVFGKVVSGRNTGIAGAEEMVGLFINTIPVRVQTERDETLGSLLRKVQQQAIESTQYDSCALSEVQQLSDVGSSLIGTIMAFENYHVAENNEQEHVIDFMLEAAREQTNYGISVIAFLQETLTIGISYDTNIYGKDEIARIAEGIATILAKNPNMLCKDISIVNDEQIRLLDSFNPVNDEYEEKTLQEIFEQTVKINGDHTALIAIDKTLSYAELNTSANKIANALIEKGIKPEDKVAFLLPRDSRLICTIFGIIKSGGAFIPVDPEYPAERIKHVLEDSEAKFIITTERNQVELNVNNGLVVDELLENEDEHNPMVEVNSTNLCYIIYTSGSTGKPKGVMIEHRNIVNYVLPLQSNFYINKYLSGAVSLSITTVAFDVFLEESLVTLTNGLTLAFADEEKVNNPMLLAEFMRKTQTEVIASTPSLIMQYLEADDFAKALGKVKVIICGGEKFPSNCFSILRKCTEAVIYNCYGPTETTIATNAKEIENEQITIGKAMSNVKLYVVDKNLNMLPIGVVGELLIGGKGVGRGYLKRQELTEEKFILFNGERVYKSGDYAKWTADGEIDIIGRIDNQIKLRGLRIELGEIESRMNEYEGITASVVAIKKLQNADYLCAYFTAKDKIDISDLCECLKKQLTAYMIPSTFTQLEKMPVTPNGKTDVKALPDPVVELQELVTPQNEMQQQLFDLVANMLGTEDFGITDDLFSVGMTSMLAIKMSVGIYKQFNINIKTNDIFKNKTIEKLEVIMKNTAKEEEIENFAQREFYPLTENQLGIYYEWEKDQQALQYNIPEVIKFSNKVDSNQLQKAVVKVIEAHPYLKTCLGMKEGQVVQLRKDFEPVRIEVAKVSEAEIQSIKKAFVQPFNLFIGPLYRIAIYYTEKNTYLFRDIHHIIIDGSALVMFATDLAKAYKGEKLNQESYTAFEYALEEDQMVGNKKYLEAERFFGNKLSDSMTVLPKGAKGEGEGQSKFVVVNVYGKSIEKFCKENAVTPSNLFLSALCNTLYRYTREERVAITTNSSGRNESKLASLMGMFAKTLPIVVHIEPSQKAADCVKAVQENMFETMENEMYPFTNMVEKHRIVPQIHYAYQGGMLERVELEGQALETEVLALNKAKFPLAISVSPNNGDYEISVEYDDSLYTHDYIETLSSAVAECAKQIAEDPEQSCGNLAIISKEDEQKVLNRFQGKVLDYDKNATFIDLFIKQVEKSAKDIALVDEKSKLTYEQADAHTDRIAKELVRLGVKQNVFVGIMLPRCKEFMVSVIGVMKAGGAYVPLDNEYPQERIEYMLEDSESKVLITEKSIYEQKCMHIKNVIFIDEFDFSTESNQEITLKMPSAEDLAYMIYTSGSTGSPKGVMIRHKSLAAFLAWRSRDYQLTEKDNLCCHSSFSFDASVEDLFTPLTVGGQLHIISEELRQNMHGLNQYFHEHDITGGTFSTQFGMELLNQFDLPLKYVIMGGEKLKPVKKTNINMVNGYGPTEFTICCSYHVVDQDKESGNIPIGKPVANSWAYVVDANNNLMPIGVAGELCIAGNQIALGYWNREDLTKEKFIDNPFQTCEENAKMYRTGDLVHWNETGELEYVGRIDNQIKLRGFRIELGEIESAMAKFSGITASVAEIKDIGKVQHLCGYFTANIEIDTNQLGEHLSQSLTEYMVPTAFMQLDKIPLTPNGKVDRKALPALALKNDNEYVAPTNELEEKLCTIFSETLTIDQVGITDSFFDLGGTSLLAMKVVVKAMAMEIGITYANVFKYQNPQNLAEFLNNKVKETVTTDVSAYDYSAIDKLLAKNTLGEITLAPMGDILLAGATGFLGIHILKEFLKNYPGKIYCLMRSHDGKSADARLKVRLAYYFENDYNELFGERIFTVEGDILELKTINVTVDTVINCAANVKHFAAGDELEKVNVGGVQNLIQYCQDNNAMLIQVSTTSVSGTGDDTMKDIKIKESQLYLGQAVDNKYIYSKFLAERCVLEAIDKGLKAKIMRVGNLMSRNTDGEFQINFKGNSFMSSLKAYKLLGKFPVEFMGGTAEVSPIDSTAKAILKLTQTNNEYTVFHPCNNHDIYMSDIIYAMKEYGFDIDIVSIHEFEECLKEKMQDDKMMSALTGILAYQENNTEKPIYVLGRTNEFTTEVLYRLNFKWPMTSEVYIKKAIDALAGLGFFDE